MKASTLFSGIGAPECAMPHWDWQWGAETDPFAAAVFATRAKTPNLGDVNDPKFTDRALKIGKPDVIVFGSPCQSFSVAGRRLGLSDPRGNLSLRAFQIIRDIQPKWFVMENVPGLLTSGRGGDFAAILEAVAEIGLYDCAWRVLDAQHFGVPQRRRRLFIVGCLTEGSAEEILLEPSGGIGDIAESKGAGESVAALTANGVGTCGADDNQAQGGHLVFENHPNDSRVKGPVERVSIQAKAGTGGGNLPQARQQKQPPMILHERITRPYGDGRNRIYENKTPTLESHERAHLSVAGGVVRRLTPTECERLQGFPDDWTCVSWRGKPTEQCPDGHRYRSVGNSMAVPVMRWILERIEKADRP